ncbi:hypothetical protein GGF43_005864, partial [Coemansia sp. RSA 2618]
MDKLEHPSGSSSTTSVNNTEASGERFIKTADDTRVNGRTGVGRCALHPCLTRRATISADGMDALGPRMDALGPRMGSRDMEGDGPSVVGRSMDSMRISGEEGARGRAAAPIGRDMAAAIGRRIEPPKPSVDAAQQPSAASGIEPIRHRLEQRAQSEVNLQTAAAEGSALAQKRRELAQAGMRHTHTTAQAVRTLERGLAESRRSGADTPTVDLVQTAVSVREVSKLIGRTVVQMSNVRRIMIVTKPGDTSLVSLTRDLAVWLIESPRSEGSAAPMVVYIEEFIARHRNFGLQRVCQKHPGVRDSMQFWTPELCSRSPEIFDFVVTLGGDGTVLYTSWLFQTT